MDIHTLRKRPSQMLTGLDSKYFARIPQRIASATPDLASTLPVTSVTNITADKASLYNTSRASSLSLLSSVAATNGSAPSATDTVSTHPKNSRDANPGKAAVIGRRVGGWVLGRWGVAPSLSSSDLRSQAAEAIVNVLASENHPVSEPALPSTTPKPVATPYRPTPFLTRSPGINQKGPIPGFLLPHPAPISLHPTSLDEESLRESLQS